ISALLAFNDEQRISRHNSADHVQNDRAHNLRRALSRGGTLICAESLESSVTKTRRRWPTSAFTRCSIGVRSPRASSLSTERSARDRSSEWASSPKDSALPM